jgi:hypothetical protein
MEAWDFVTALSRAAKNWWEYLKNRRWRMAIEIRKCHTAKSIPSSKL